MASGIDPIGNPSDPHSSQSLATGDSMVEPTQTLATGPAAGPTATQSFGSGASQDYDRGDGRDEKVAELPATSAPIPTETDDSGAAAGDASVDPATLSNPKAGEYSTGGDAEIKGEPWAGPTGSA